jgi:hypothetical protein
MKHNINGVKKAVPKCFVKDKGCFNAKVEK